MESTVKSWGFSQKSSYRLLEPLAWVLSSQSQVLHIRKRSVGAPANRRHPEVKSSDVRFRESTPGVCALARQVSSTKWLSREGISATLGYESIGGHSMKVTSSKLSVSLGIPESTSHGKAHRRTPMRF
ncbi:hypothetical protein VNO77_20327 [Canavalia gladiata]|uniref:Uncharacterized protein n=1 Tax=Canavalia gladiata TaxID=3824 RepID=A0AAN9QQG0_CANGL